MIGGKFNNPRTGGAGGETYTAICPNMSVFALREINLKCPALVQLPHDRSTVSVQKRFGTNGDFVSGPLWRIKMELVDEPETTALDPYGFHEFNEGIDMRVKWRAVHAVCSSSACARLVS